MNASGRPNTCKSRGSTIKLALLVATGARVRNAYATYLILGYSPEKFGLIPHSIIESHGLIIKGYGTRWACVPLARW
jgi:hypothetical protein